MREVSRGEVEATVWAPLEVEGLQERVANANNDTKYLSILSPVANSAASLFRR
jgi:hypothetical protein